ncbi:hypothetical protein R69888_00316 [Paraburkholderia haematera]|uniref:Uncharacterized protein n=1 Tax=Paraburkholderia haematera TaxID=2793077 RepID=A0ABM8QEJ8_9BURK|nr:hypothetical protein R69888_00316 [Paraburkholderia haematera]
MPTLGQGWKTWGNSTKRASPRGQLLRPVQFVDHAASELGLVLHKNAYF